MLTCVNPTLDRPVILFQDVIKILDRSVLTVLLQNTVGFELNDDWWISRSALTWVTTVCW